jgi:hydroxymethylpyrimidine/phosphomethylpyrimidine kinase
VALAGWITPNLSELAILTGLADSEVPDSAVMDRGSIAPAAHRLKEAAAKLGNPDLNVVVTGGHLERPDDFLLTSSEEELWLRGEPVVTRATHGTGCALSSALLCYLVRGERPEEALRHAKSYVTQALQNAYPVGQGRGPMNHFFALDRKS